MDTTSAAPPFITCAPGDVAGWAACFDVDALPVLAATAHAIEALRANEDDVDAHLLAETVGGDPLLTLRVMAHVARLRRSHGDEARGEPETLTAALVMLGIGPFFRAFPAPMPTVEARLADHPEALAGLRAVLRCSHRAANFALGFAVHRMDHDAPVIHAAGLLHDFAELLLWLRAPALALEIERRQQADPTLRSAAIQRELLNIELVDLQHELMLRWRLPPLLVRIADDRHADSDQVRSVLLAVHVARHSAHGWDNAALPDDVNDVAALLRLGAEPARALLLAIDS
jgi:HD-like signal output (HDOD) protein